MKKRLLWIDMAKGLAIMLMVMGHCLSDQTWLRAFIYSFHMPLFFVLAGFTMRAKPRRDVLVSSLKRLMLPYAVVCAILLFFAFVPPDSINPNLDSQFSWDVVVLEIAFGAGQEGEFLGISFEAIGAIWFLPCLFIARLAFNEILLAGKRLRGRLEGRAHAEAVGTCAELALTAVVTCAGFQLGWRYHLPLDFDIALVAVFYLCIGHVIKKVGVERVPGVVWLILLAVWLQYAQAGNNEMAIRAYLEHPWSLATSAAGSLVIMRCLTSLEQLAQGAASWPAKALGTANRAFAWLGVNSLTILCVHRVESAIFNWQKIMETFAPSVWSWTLMQQGLYQFALRFAFVVALTAAFLKLRALVHGKLKE